MKNISVDLKIRVFVCQQCGDSISSTNQEWIPSKLLNWGCNCGPQPSRLVEVGSVSAKVKTFGKGAFNAGTMWVDKQTGKDLSTL